ncbi:hypothetical protein [Rathayibacter toxicus]|uniref:hypothetical protein n=1 Tax=Rathayibacter toxicus TaxID=145458 RepID=UPI000B1EAB0F|nr:hypothetical protein [Rathayibacter toxicus]QOD07934.1 hypothetical protein AYW78_08740 [Rathayibacter toxicus]QOD10034.1 hypothetical protein BSG36_08910 [Rathayibacter toxicus]QWL26599.1 hypothetical protein E2R32_08590 [Rathayibacter toxicus]QWL28711.1 hypothetical protein E2R33_08945 [Rathayibacter toxicus]QWL30797.1 hypothetical protein E2R34_08655 [Rathayibacter toxicus]
MNTPKRGIGPATRTRPPVTCPADRIIARLDPGWTRPAGGADRVRAVVASDQHAVLTASVWSLLA